jgi:hypothetical protein
MLDFKTLFASSKDMQGNIVPWIKTDETGVSLSGNFFFPLEETVNVYYDYGSLGCDAV